MQCRFFSSSRGDDLREIFTRHGPIQDVYIPLDYYTREPRGFAYVQYPQTKSVKGLFYLMPTIPI